MPKDETNKEAVIDVRQNVHVLDPVKEDEIL